MTEIETWDGPFHRREIARGEYGKPSKVLEEVEEAEDALEQGQVLMLMIECADIVGALCGLRMPAGEYDPDVELEVYEQMNPGTYGLGKTADQDPETNAANQLQRMRDILGTGRAQLTQQQIQTLASCALSIAQLRSIEWPDLVEFARLRSRVARYAVRRAYAAEAEAFAQDQEPAS